MPSPTSGFIVDRTATRMLVRFLKHMEGQSTTVTSHAHAAFGACVERVCSHHGTLLEFQDLPIDLVRVCSRLVRTAKSAIFNSMVRM